MIPNNNLNINQLFNENKPLNCFNSQNKIDSKSDNNINENKIKTISNENLVNKYLSTNKNQAFISLQNESNEKIINNNEQIPINIPNNEIQNPNSKSNLIFNININNPENKEITQDSQLSDKKINVLFQDVKNLFLNMEISKNMKKYILGIKSIIVLIQIAVKNFLLHII